LAASCLTTNIAGFRERQSCLSGHPFSSAGMAQRPKEVANRISSQTADGFVFSTCPLALRRSLWGGAMPGHGIGFVAQTHYFDRALASLRKNGSFGILVPQKTPFFAFSAELSLATFFVGRRHARPPHWLRSANHYFDHALGSFFQGRSDPVPWVRCVKPLISGFRFRKKRLFFAFCSKIRGHP